jgi:hypothetical protein
MRACLTLISFNRIKQWRVDDVRAARERIAAINQARAQREADKESEQEGTPLRVGNPSSWLLCSSRFKPRCLPDTTIQFF